MSTKAHRVAALYDVHGNFPALEAALEAVESAGVDLLVFGGDLALGPMPREVVDRVIGLGSRGVCLRGNCDRLMVDAFDGRPPGSLPDAVRESIEWAAAQLDRSQRDFLAGLPATLTIDVDGLGYVLFCHATPRSDDEIFTPGTPEELKRTPYDGNSAARNIERTAYPNAAFFADRYVLHPTSEHDMLTALGQSDSV